MESKIDKNQIELNRRGRKPGTPKTGGRQKGSVNATTALSKAKWSEVLEHEEFSIPSQAIKLFNHMDTSPALKFQILQFLAQYTTSAIKPKEEDEIPLPDSNNEPTNLLDLVK